MMFALAAGLQGQGQKVLTTTTTKIFQPSLLQSPFFHCTPDPVQWLSSHRELAALHGHMTMAECVLPEGKIRGFSPQTVEAVQSLGLFDWILVEADGAARRPLKAPAEHEPVVPEASSVVLVVAGMWGVGKPLCSQWVFRPERFASLAGLRLQDTIFPEHLFRVLVHPLGPLKASPAQSRNVLFLNLGSERRNKGGGKDEQVQTVLEQTQAGYELRMSGWVDKRASIQVMNKIYIG